MRIALFTETFLPKLDGIVNTLCYLLEYLQREGHEAIVIAPEGGPSEYAGAKVIGLPGAPFPLYPELKMISPIITVREEIEAFKPDVIHVAHPIALGLIGLKHSKQLGIPVVASYHTDLSGFAEQWGLGIFSEPLWAYMRWVHNQADLNLCPSRATMKILEDRSFERLRVWTRGVDTERFNPGHKSQEWRERLSDGHPDAPLLLFVGRLSAEKRVEWVKDVLQAIPGARLAVVGDGPAGDTVREYFAGTPTHFTGFLTGQDLSHAYASADLFVFPAMNETLGNVLLESMASGVPVIGAAAGGPLDIVLNDETGYLVDPDSQQAFVDAAKRIIENPEKHARMRVRSREHAEANNWDSVFKLLMDDYKDVASKKKQPGPAIMLQETIKRAFDGDLRPPL